MPGTKVCIECGGSFEARNVKREVCGKDCKAKRRLKVYGESLPFDSLLIADLHETLVVVDMLKRGYKVFRGYRSQCPDLVAKLGDGPYLGVEVTTGRRHTVTGHLSYPNKDKDADKFDLLAVVEHSGRINYFPEI